MSTYEHNTKEHIEYKDVLFKFSYVFFILIIGIVALEQRYYPKQVDCTTNDFKSFRSDLKCTEGNLFSYQMADTVITYKPTKHRNPLTGTIDKFYGE